MQRTLRGNGVPGDADATDQDFALICYNCIEMATPVINDGATIFTNENCLPPNGMIDPGETVSIEFALQNLGTADTSNLIATLQEAGGVTSPSAPQSYGILIAGGPAVSREFTFTSDGLCGTDIVATFALEDGATDLGTVSFNLSTGTPNAVTAFTNAATITINDNTIANPYPSAINVSGVNGAVKKVTVRLNDLTHTFPDDLDILVVGPQGQKVMLMGEAGGGGNVSLIDLTFDDAAATQIPDNATLTTGTFRPANYFSDSLQAPAPTPPYANTLSVFNGTDPNGTWNLYVRDDGNLDIGTIGGGWTLNVTGSDCCTNICPEITMSPATLPDGILGATYDQTISGNGGTSPYTFVITSGSLPDGLSLNPNTGQIVGPATALGPFNFTVEATDANGCEGTQDYSITISCPEITLDPATLPGGTVGSLYDQTVSGVGGAAPYTFAVTSGTLPTGLTLDSNTGQISGTPSEAGTFNFDITATDANACAGVTSYSITMACPVITANPATLPDGTIGVSYDETVSGSGGTAPYTFAVTNGALPDGLTLDSNTGQISGTATDLGTFNFDITATDDFGCTGTTSYTVNINCPEVTVLPATLPNGTVGTAYDQTVSGNGGADPYTFAVTSGALPDGLTLDSNTGQISGTPSAAGTFNFDITATDDNGCTGVTSYSITMSCPAITVNPATLPNGTMGTLYDQTVSGSGGTAPYTFAVTSGSLPTGLTLDSNTGQITGTPTALGTFNFDITATDNFGCTGTTSYSVTIDCPAITVLPATLPNGTVGALYDQTVSGSGSTAPYTFAVTSGSLPTGLTLDANTGQITGTPSASGTFNFDITATDANACAGVTSYSITMSCPVITVLPATLPDGAVGMLYDQMVSGIGGTAPYAFVVSSGTLPDGLTLNPITGQITGTPTTLGTSNFMITATDSFGCTGTTSYSITINCPVITVTPGTLPNGTVGSLYDQTVSGNGGTAPYTFAVTSGSLPTGLTLDANTGQITGTPTIEGSFNFDITATDANDCTGTTSYSVDSECLFCDEFNDSTVDSNWTYIKTITKWSEDGNALSGSHTKKIQAFAIPAFGGCTTCYAETVMRSSGDAYVWFLFHVQDKNNMVELLMRENTNSWVLKHRVNKKVIAKQRFVSTIDADTDYTVRIRYDGTNYIASVDGVDIITLAPGAAVNGGSVGYKLRRGTGTFQRIEVN